MMASLTKTTAPEPSSATAKMTEAEEDAITLVPEDMTLFGTLNAQIADEWSDRLQAALRSGITSLPLMSGNERADKLFDYLCPNYLRNIDLAEFFCGRNIFSVSMFSEKRRSRLVHAFLNGTIDGDPTQANEPLKDAPVQSKQHDDSSLVNLAPENIPAKEQLEALKVETAQLRQRLQQAKQRRVEAQQALAQAQAAKQVAQQASQRVKDDDTHTDVTATLVGVQGLAEANTVGKSLVQALDENKQNRQNDDDEYVPSPKKQKVGLSLQEQYQEERKVFGETEHLKQVQQLLQQDKE